MSYAPQIAGLGEYEGHWLTNGLRFATAGEAINYCNQWEPSPKYRRAVESKDPVTHRWTLDGLVTVASAELFTAKRSRAAKKGWETRKAYNR